jgi:hypothetical protein
MIGKFGSDQQQLADSGGGVISEDGALLIDGDSDGESALLFGPAALREIQAGVANGDFSIAPADAEGTITADNALPYWTFTDATSAGAITCAIVTDTSSASGTSLRWSITAGTANSRSATLRRFVPVSSTRNRAFAYSPEVNTFGATNTAIATIRMQAQFYKVDQATTTGTAIDSGVITFATLGTGSNWLTGSYTTANAAPSDAAFCLITITVATAAAGTVVASQVTIPEVRLIRGDQTNLFAEYTTPATYAPTLVRQVNGELQISPNAGSGNTKFGGDITVSGGDINFDTRLSMSPLTTSTMNIIRNDTGTRSSLAIDRLFLGDQTTRFLDDDGTYITVSAALRTATINQNDGSGYYHDTPSVTSGTGQIANEAMWVVSSGTNYQLRRSTGTSWARFKKNIEESSLTPEQFRALEFVQFDWNEKAMREQFPNLDQVSTEKQHGLLLDQLVNVMPEAVQQPLASTDTETVAWHVVHMAAMIALQDAIKRIEVLETKVAELERS